jgi:adenylate cyclase
MGGQEMSVGVLFADVRGFTALAESQTPQDTTRLLNRFYDVATDVLTERDAIFDKMMGDEFMALFLPMIPSLGDRTCDVLADAGEALLRAVGYD